MTWNYRVIRADGPNGESTHAVHEVYYNDAGEPYAWTDAPARPIGDTLQELADDLVHMKAACGKPVLVVAGSPVAKLTEAADG